MRKWNIQWEATQQHSTSWGGGGVEYDLGVPMASFGGRRKLGEGTTFMFTSRSSVLNRVYTSPNGPAGVTLRGALLFRGIEPYGRHASKGRRRGVARNVKGTTVASIVLSRSRLDSSPKCSSRRTNLGDSCPVQDLGSRGSLILFSSATWTRRRTILQEGVRVWEKRV